MPRIKSAIKRARQALVRRDRLQPYKTHMKTMLRKMNEAAKAGNKEEVAKLLPEVYKTVDMATKKNIIHPNTAARKKAAAAKLAAAK